MYWVRFALNNCFSDHFRLGYHYHYFSKYPVCEIPTWKLNLKLTRNVCVMREKSGELVAMTRLKKEQNRRPRIKWWLWSFGRMLAPSGLDPFLLRDLIQPRCCEFLFPFCFCGNGCCCWRPTGVGRMNEAEEKLATQIHYQEQCHFPASGWPEPMPGPHSHSLLLWLYQLELKG